MARAPKRLKLEEWTPAEKEIHLSVLSLCRTALPQRAIVLHVPNGIEAGPAEWNRMRALGAITGWPDITVLLDGGACCLECKAEDGEEREEQEACAKLLAAAGVPRAVVRSQEDAYRALVSWGLPVKSMYFPGWPEPAPPHPLSRGLLVEWREALTEAARAWNRWLATFPQPQLVWRELAEAVGALRRPAVDSTTEGSARRAR